MKSRLNQFSIKHCIFWSSCLRPFLRNPLWINSQWNSVFWFYCKWLFYEIRFELVLSQTLCLKSLKMDHLIIKPFRNQPLYLYSQSLVRDHPLYEIAFETVLSQILYLKSLVLMKFQLNQFSSNSLVGDQLFRSRLGDLTVRIGRLFATITDS